MESIVSPSLKRSVNRDGFKPGEQFTRDHKQLLIEGEKWMKETATSCTVVGALIVTIMFTVAFTVPGGNVEGSGLPLFLHKKSFKVFIVSDAISLFASSTSVIILLRVFLDGPPELFLFDICQHRITKKLRFDKAPSFII